MSYTFSTISRIGKDTYTIQQKTLVQIMETKSGCVCGSDHDEQPQCYGCLSKCNILHCIFCSMRKGYSETLMAQVVKSCKKIELSTINNPTLIP